MEFGRKYIEEMRVKAKLLDHGCIEVEKEEDKIFLRNLSRDLVCWADEFEDCVSKKHREKWQRKYILKLESEIKKYFDKLAKNKSRDLFESLWAESKK